MRMTMTMMRTMENCADDDDDSRADHVGDAA